MKNDIYVTKKEAVKKSFGDLSKRQMKEVEAGVDFLREQDNSYRAYFVFKLLKLNKELSDGKCGVRTLVDLRRGTIEGSDHCDVCLGVLGKDHDVE